MDGAREAERQHSVDALPSTRHTMIAVFVHPSLLISSIPLLHFPCPYTAPCSLLSVLFLSLSPSFSPLPLPILISPQSPCSQRFATTVICSLSILPFLASLSLSVSVPIRPAGSLVTWSFTQSPLSKAGGFILCVYAPGFSSHARNASRADFQHTHSNQSGGMSNWIVRGCENKR